MSKSDNWRRAGAALVVAASLLVPMAAGAGLVEEKNAAATAPAPKVAAGYLLRCWQEGKLIVEEQLAKLPPTVDLNSAKLRALDTDNQAVYVTETKNATCLIRARFAERARGTSR